MISDSNFRLLVADLYEEAINGGPEAARGAAEWLKRERPVPEPWWSVDVWGALMRAAGGATDVLSPQRLRNYELFEATRRPIAEKGLRVVWNPHAPGSDRYRQRREGFDNLVASLLKYVGESSQLDHGIATLLASALQPALNAEPSYRPSGDAVYLLRSLVGRLSRHGCLPTPEPVQAATRTLQNILEYWEWQDGGIEDEHEK